MIDLLYDICKPDRRQRISHPNQQDYPIIAKLPRSTSDSSDASAPNQSDAPRPRRGSQPVLQLPPDKQRSARSSSVSHSIAPPPADSWNIEEYAHLSSLLSLLSCPMLCQGAGPSQAQQRDPPGDGRAPPQALGLQLLQAQGRRVQGSGTA